MWKVLNRRYYKEERNENLRSRMGRVELSWDKRKDIKGPERKSLLNNLKTCFIIIWISLKQNIGGFQLSKCLVIILVFIFWIRQVCIVFLIFTSIFIMIIDSSIPLLKISQFAKSSNLTLIIYRKESLFWHLHKTYLKITIILLCNTSDRILFYINALNKANCLSNLRMSL